MDVYQKVTDAVIKRLEEGVVPWEIPWHNGYSFPSNYYTKEQYHGINVFLLTATQMYMEYKHNLWIGYGQAVKAGGNIKKGEKATQIFFFKPIVKETEDGEEKVVRFIFKYHSVFNIEQAEGLEVEDIQENNPVITSGEQLVANWEDKPRIIDQPQAYYSVDRDTVGCPNLSKFKSSDYYYSTLFHELIHSTRHPKRLNRDKDSSQKGYGKEELVAEMGASFLCAITGVESDKTRAENASYIDGWLKNIREDKSLVPFAASQAQKAVEYIKSHSIGEIAV